MRSGVKKEKERWREYLGAVSSLEGCVDLLPTEGQGW